MKTFKELYEYWYFSSNIHTCDSELLRKTISFMNSRADHLNHNKSFKQLIKEYLQDYYKTFTL